MEASDPSAVFGEAIVDVPLEAMWKQRSNSLLRSDPRFQASNSRRCWRKGDAAERILDAAKIDQSDLIVMGTHGRTGLGRLLMGSVAEQVLRGATCAVLTVKTPLSEAVLSEVPRQTNVTGRSKVRALSGAAMKAGNPRNRFDLATCDGVTELEELVRDSVGGRLREFRLVVADSGLILQGRAPTYYGKQLAQHAVMQATCLPILANEIEVQ